MKSFTKNHLCVHVRLRMDNTSAVACLARESDSSAWADITSFLSDCFNEGLEYRTLNTYIVPLGQVFCRQWTAFP